jgi:hypothetical protein
MNQDQVINLIQSIGKIAGAVAATYGAETQNMVIAIFGAVTSILAFYFSHKSNATPAPDSTQPTQKSTTLKTGVVIGTMIASSLILAGCSTGTVQKAVGVNGTIIAGVNTLMAGWAGYVNSKVTAGNPPSITLSKDIVAVSNAYNIYYTSELISSNAAYFYAQNPTNVSFSNNAYIALMTLNASQSNISTLISAGTSH